MPALSPQVLGRAQAIEADPRWTTVMRRDKSADGSFVLGVRTTGIYCRPSCPARHPRPENVSFYLSCEEAEASGLRACRRCHPKDATAAGPHAEAVAAACKLIEAGSETPSLEALAGTAGMSPFHFHRVFKSVTGLTPRGYFDALRARRMQASLDDADTSVTAAIYDAGYGSASRFYERAGAMLGMTPTSYRKGGAGENIHFALGQCSLGAILVACSPKGVCAITIGDDPDRLARDLQDRFPHARLIGDDANFAALVAKVVGFVEQPAIGLDLPLDIRGTAFQQRVWDALRQIPVGQTRSYAEVARQIGAPRAMRAVAQACAANAIAVAVPCHRVIRHDGDVSGYRWGVERKQALLASERGA